MSTRARTFAALATALTLGTTAAGAGVAGASPTPRASVETSSTCTKGSRASPPSHRERTDRLGADTGVALARHGPGTPWSVTDDGTTLGTATVRTVSDSSFSIARTLLAVDGEQHVVFTATNLRTGARCVLNGPT